MPSVKNSILIVYQQADLFIYVGIKGEHPEPILSIPERVKLFLATIIELH